jgi:hypothetical protein
MLCGKNNAGDEKYINQGFPIKTTLQTNSKKIRHGFHGLSGLTPELFIKIRVNLLNRRFSVSDFLTFTNKVL